MPASSVLESVLSAASAFSPYALPPRVLTRLAQTLEAIGATHTAETGCGASTLVFSHLSKRHAVFAFNEFEVFERVDASKLRGPAEIQFVEGPTQQTLPQYCFETTLDAVLLDGPHAFPFPQLEYFFLYPRLRAGGLLVIDDLQIPTVHQLYEFVRRDAMFELEAVVHRTAFLRRTQAPTFPPDADGWERQAYNSSTLLRFTWREKLRRALRKCTEPFK